ncbi:zinc-ribbon domain-containing protein [Rhodococcus sp. JS3073]|uniref:zinc-ribbon domain-containing protein n=1 Tax=Rhodococcus sp. JS3073 TaxID=3002901 RepID=UPI003FA7152D
MLDAYDRDWREERKAREKNAQNPQSEVNDPRSPQERGRPRMVSTRLARGVVQRWILRCPVDCLQAGGFPAAMSPLQQRIPLPSISGRPTAGEEQHRPHNAIRPTHNVHVSPTPPGAQVELDIDQDPNTECEFAFKDRDSDRASNGRPAKRRRHPPLRDALIGRSLRPIANLTHPPRGIDVTAGTADYFSWECFECGHTWPAQANKVAVDGNGCPNCAGRIQPSLADVIERTTLKLLRNHSHPERDVDQLTSRSSDTCRWRCNRCGHEWRTRVARAVDEGCSKCRFLARSAPTVSAAAVASDLLSEFRENLTTGRDLFSVGPSVHDRCRWVCSQCGHEWTAIVANRVKGAGCKPCGTRRSVNKRASMLALVRPDLVAQFVRNVSRPERSAQTTPAYCDDRIEWQCEFGHRTWETVVDQRSTQNTGCPECSQRQRRSRFELEVGHLISAATGLQVLYDHPLRHTHRGRRYTERIDLYLPELDLMIDLDPEYWHSRTRSLKSDRAKTARMGDYHYVRVRPTSLPDAGGACVPVTHATEDPESWWIALSSQLRSLGVTPKALDSQAVRQARAAAGHAWIAVMGAPPSPSLASKSPTLSAEFVANLDRPTIGPELLAPTSTDYCLWRCRWCGTDKWRATVASRSGGSEVCPLCSSQARGRKRARPPEGCSLADTYPDVARRFVKNLSNPGVGPTEFFPRSGDRCVWSCATCEGLVEKRVADAVVRFSCVQCGWKRTGESRTATTLNKGRNLATTHPHLAAQVDVARTGRQPAEIPTAGRDKIWWICSVDNKHRWQAPPYSRTNRRQPTGCPACAGKRSGA